MTLRRFMLLFLAAVLVEAGVFALSYDDLLFLRRPAGQILSQSETEFVEQANAALDRETLTTAHLETIAGAAQGFGMPALEVRALRRLTVTRPTDVGARLRLADALRRAGDFPRAEQEYLAVLTSLETRTP
jgi:hypothetical protein